MKRNAFSKKMSSKTLYCFVCDIAVTNRFFSLASCRTQSSKKKLIEKLGNLVGDKYLVVITEDDVICRSCANLMNTLDRLEVEMSSVRRVVLRFLERKYSLQEGELLHQKGNVIQQESEKSNLSLLVKKKNGDAENDEDVECNHTDPRSKVWLQCEKCQYTTNCTSFMKNHIREEVCLECEGPTINGVCAQNCNGKSKIDESVPATDVMDKDTESMELIVNNLSLLNGTNDETLSLIEPEPTIPDKYEVTLNMGDTGEMSFADKKAEDKEEKPALYLQVVDGEEDDFESGSVRQVFAVAGDGSVEMMEIMWNEETNSPVTEMPF